MIYEKETLPLTHKRYEQHFEYMFILVKGKLKTFNGLMEKSIHFGQSKVSAKNSASLNEKGSKQGGKLGKVMTIKEYKLRGNIWEYETGLNGHSKDEIAFKHPAIFPEKLAEDHIVSWSNENDIVYDCFGGSGTTAKMAHKWKRNWILSEISKEYCDIAEKRLKQYLTQTTLF
jgi:site-specific DNA-methyltransferase (adenine-specific)